MIRILEKIYQSTLKTTEMQIYFSIMIQTDLCHLWSDHINSQASSDLTISNNNAKMAENFS